MSEEASSGPTPERLVDEPSYRLLFEKMLAGMAVHEVVLDQDGRPTDYIFLDANPAFERLTAMRREDIIGKRVTEVLPGIEHDPANWIGTYGDVALGGGDRRMELFSEPLGRWFSVLAYSTAPRRFVTIFEDITEEKQTQKTLEKQRYYLAKAQELGRIGTWELDILGNELHWTDENCRIFGVPPGSVVDYELFLSKVHPEDRDFVHREWSRAMAGEPYDIEHRLVPGAGAEWVREKAEVAFDDQGRAISAIGFTQDVTEARKLRLELQRTRRLEAIGRLAGGIAHDFNNQLMVIGANAEFLLLDLPEHSPLRQEVQDIREAAAGAASLTEQLLAFARRRQMSPAVLRPGAIVKRLESMLRRVLGESLELETRLPEDLGSIRMDPAGFEQVMMNLILNARDAMPSGGRLTIVAENLLLGAGHPLAATLPTGSWVQIEVRDTGHGMSDEVLEQIFEPFFTTKVLGRGSGLGLATVYGIIQQSHGHITVRSVEEQGSVFTIFLPTIEQSQVEDTPSGPSQDLRGDATVLVVEDQPKVRQLTARTLERFGYTVLCAQDGATAIQIFEQHRGSIDLLLTDVVMPGVNGVDLARRLRDAAPSLPIVIMSGYSDEEAIPEDLASAPVRFLAKPFGRAALLRTIREIQPR